MDLTEDVIIAEVIIMANIRLLERLHIGSAKRNEEQSKTKNIDE